MPMHYTLYSHYRLYTDVPITVSADPSQFLSAPITMGPGTCLWTLPHSVRPPPLCALVNACVCVCVDAYRWKPLYKLRRTYNWSRQKLSCDSVPARSFLSNTEFKFWNVGHSQHDWNKLHLSNIGHCDKKWSVWRQVHHEAFPCNFG